MENVIKFLLSTEMWAAGFLWPLATQVLVATGAMQTGWQAWVAGAVIAAFFGVLVRVRGSWVWIK